MPRRSAGALGMTNSPRTWEVLAIDALDRGDHGLGAQLRDDGAEMLEVIDLEIDGEFGEVRRAPGHVDVVDVAVMLGNDGGDLRETPWFVDVLHQQPRRKPLWVGIV